MKYILTILTAAFALSACHTTDSHATCPHAKAKAGDSCCAKGAKKDCCAKKH